MPTTVRKSAGVGVREPAAGRPTESCKRRASEQARRGAAARNGKRPRGIDPTTSDRDYTRAELEFMHAMHAYGRRTGRKFPTFSETLGVLRSLGYAKQHRT